MPPLPQGPGSVSCAGPAAPATEGGRPSPQHRRLTHLLVTGGFFSCSCLDLMGFQGCPRRRWQRQAQSCVSRMLSGWSKAVSNMSPPPQSYVLCSRSLWDLCPAPSSFPFTSFRKKRRTDSPKASHQLLPQDPLAISSGASDPVELSSSH